MINYFTHFEPGCAGSALVRNCANFDIYEEVLLQCLEDCRCHGAKTGYLCAVLLLERLQVI